MLNRLRQLELALFSAAFFVSNWDLLLVHKAGGFTLKLYQPLLLLCALVSSWPLLFAGKLEELVAPLKRPFALCILALAFFYLGVAPWSAFPLKSFLYSCWLLFDVAVLWLTAQRLFEKAPPAFFAFVAFAPLLFTSIVILIDFAAYPFGYRGGLIGNNQDIILNLSVSRPHAFASEPSYAAAVLTLGLLTVGPFLMRTARRKWLTTAGLALVVFAIVATTSRSGWASLGLGAVVLALLPALAGRRMPWRPILVSLTALPLLVGIFLLVSPASQLSKLNEIFITKIFSGTDSSGNSRVKALKLAVGMARETGGLGTGIGASYRYFRDHGGYDMASPEAFDQHNYGNEVIMSTWGQLIAEGGVAGVLLYAMAGFFLIRSLWRAWRATDSLLAYGSMAAAIVFFGFTALWLGNVCRGDMWVWFALWSGIAASSGRAPQAL